MRKRIRLNSLKVFWRCNNVEGRMWKKKKLLKVWPIATPAAGIKVPLVKVYRGWRILAGFEMLKSERVCKREMRYLGAWWKNRTLLFLSLLRAFVFTRALCACVINNGKRNISLRRFRKWNSTGGASSTKQLEDLLFLYRRLHILMQSEWEKKGSDRVWKLSLMFRYDVCEYSSTRGIFLDFIQNWKSFCSLRLKWNSSVSCSSGSCIVNWIFESPNIMSCD